MPFIASLSDIFGRAICLLVSLAVFTIGTIICCVAQDLATLIAGRCVQGIGGGGLIILGLVIFTDIVPLRFRSKYYGIIQGAWAIGTCIGPLVGGGFVERTTWRWIFYIMFPFIGISFATIPFVLTLKPRTESLSTKLARVDWFGGALFIMSSTAFLIAVSWGGTQEPWSSFRTIVPLVLGSLGLIAMGVFEAYFAKEPFFGRNLFHSRDAFAAYLGATLQGFLVSFSSFVCVSVLLTVIDSCTVSSTMAQCISWR
jgi:MFS family permease